MPKTDKTIAVCLTVLLLGYVAAGTAQAIWGTDCVAAEVRL